MKLLVPCAVFVLSITSTSNQRVYGQIAVGTPNPNVPELKVLDRFAGTWKASLANSTETVTSTRQWVLDGHFLKHEFAISGGALRGIIYRGYNVNADRYTMIFIDSQGNASLLHGFWDEGLTTMTYEAVDSSCPVQKYESYFSDPTTETWTITFDNDKQSRISGTAEKQAK